MPLERGRDDALPTLAWIVMASKDSDKFSRYDETLGAAIPTDPWGHAPGDPPVYEPDYDLLGRLLTLPVRAGAASESGAFPAGIDAWIAHELRRAGFSEDEVWPRAQRPRVLPRDVATLLERLPARAREELAERIRKMPAVAPVEARVLGRAYVKQVDVGIARWDRGPEVLVSTKAQLSSFRKNLPNRFEESYGDAGNLRARYPLAAVGYFFVQRSKILTDEPDAFELAIDMIRKLRDIGDGSGYTTTGLLLVEWDDPPSTATVHARPEDVPADVAPPRFFSELIQHVLSISPVPHHVRVRSLLERRAIPVPEADTDGGDIVVPLCAMLVYLPHCANAR